MDTGELWQSFAQSGSVENYLQFKAATNGVKEQTADAIHNDGPCDS